MDLARKLRPSAMPRSARLGVPLVAIALAAAACGSSSSVTNTGSAGAGAGTGGSAASSSGSTASGVTIQTTSGSLGTFLTDGTGRSLYLFAPDTPTKSTCSGACASEWPPLTTKTSATAGMGATASDISTIMRSDGAKQVT